MFPDLRDRVHDVAASLFRGERQMLAISRALISDPSSSYSTNQLPHFLHFISNRLLKEFDPLREQELQYYCRAECHSSSISIDRGYIVANGKIVHSGDAQHILTDPEIGEYFLGSH